ncbi:MAG: hypothetical protein KBA26_02550 [Candidatus Delongbacteria bacterium]|nr:hypothetical protein [Candidatus Delongbacteria bacterium]
MISFSSLIVSSIIIPKISTCLKIAILFFPFLPLILAADPAPIPPADYARLITSNPWLTPLQQHEFIDRINRLKKSTSLTRYVTDSLMIPETLLYQLTNNLPLAAKLVNIGTHKHYEITRIDSCSFYADDHIALKGTIYLLANRDRQILFYAEGSARFLMNDYKMKGSMHVRYAPSGADRTGFEAEIMVYPNNPFARNLLKFLLNLGFGAYADRKISNINRVINRTAQRMKIEPGWFRHVLAVDSLRQGYQLTPTDSAEIQHLLQQLRKEKP